MTRDASAKYSSSGHDALEVLLVDASQPASRSLSNHILEHVLGNIFTQLLCHASQVIDCDFSFLPFRKQRIRLLYFLVLRFRVVVSCM